MAEVRLEGIRKRIGKIEVIPDLTLTVREGEFFTLVGPSGCGKSTLLHLIAGLDAPTSGRIVFDNRDVTSLPPRERDVALVFQNYALYPHMTVAENLAFPLRVGPVAGRRDRAWIEREVRRVADLLGLYRFLERRPRELSGGQRQRVALGRAIIRKPRVFLLDEPLSNLDAQLRADMRAELRRLHDELRITMIYVTHDQTEAMTLADRLAVLDHGSLLQVATPQDAYDRPANLFVAQFIGHPSMNIVDGRLEGPYTVAGPLRLPMPAALQPLHGESVKVGFRPEEIKIHPFESGIRERNGNVVQGTVRLVEPASGHVWVTCEVAWDARRSGAVQGIGSIVGSAERTFKGRPGDLAVLSFDGATPHLFDEKTGQRVGAVD